MLKAVGGGTRCRAVGVAPRYSEPNLPLGPQWHVTLEHEFVACGYSISKHSAALCLSGDVFFAVRLADKF